MRSAVAPRRFRFRLLKLAVPLFALAFVGLPASQGAGAQVTGARARRHVDAPTNTAQLNSTLPAWTRTVLLRSYLTDGGRATVNADLPKVTMYYRNVQTGVVTPYELNTCPRLLEGDGETLQYMFGNRGGRDSATKYFSSRTRLLGLHGNNGKPFPFCSWFLRVQTKVYDTPNWTRNQTPVQNGSDIFLPDSAATYWAFTFDSSTNPQPGFGVLDHVEIGGTFQPQAFMSYVMYDENMDFYYYKNGDGTLCQSYNTDYQIQPDPGSVNPWQTPTTNYDGTYKLELEYAPSGTDCAPGGPGPNKATGTNPNVLTISRTGSGYGPDTAPNVQVLNQSFFPDNPADTLLSSTSTEAQQRAGRLLQGRLASSGCSFFREGAPCPHQGMHVAPTSSAQGSVWSNPVAGYLINAVVPLPGYVYVFRGKAPRVPQGTTPVPWADDGLANYDMRYYSVCVDEGIFPYPASNANWSCANGNFGTPEYNAQTNPDGLSKIAVGADGYWTIVLSTTKPAKNLSNATWIKAKPFIPAGVLVRNMVVQDSFKTSVPNVPRDASWVSAFKQMGDYYPVQTTACTAQQFEQRGWDIPDPAGPGTQGCFVPTPTNTQPPG